MNTACPKILANSTMYADSTKNKGTPIMYIYEQDPLRKNFLGKDDMASCVFFQIPIPININQLFIRREAPLYTNTLSVRMYLCPNDNLSLRGALVLY